MKVKIAHTKQEKNDVFQIRTTVFIHEQHVPPEREVDQFDGDAIHFIGYVGHTPISAGRLRFVDDYGKLERICTLKEHRGKSYGKKIINKMEETIQKHQVNQAKLNAQTHAINFYKRLGYQVMSEEFIDAGIPHVTMVKTIANQNTIE